MCETKRCSKCGEVKHVAEFSRASRSKDGRQSDCKKCVSARQRTDKNYAAYQTAYRASHREERRAYDKALTIKFPERKRLVYARNSEGNKETCRAYKAANREKIRAQNIVNRAVASKLLPPATVCNTCGAEDHVEYHHPDYSKPLQVVPLCVACHQRLHAELRRTTQSLTR